MTEQHARNYLIEHGMVETYCRELSEIGVWDSVLSVALDAVREKAGMAILAVDHREKERIARGLMELDLQTEQETVGRRHA